MVALVPFVPAVGRSIMADPRGAVTTARAASASAAASALPAAAFRRVGTTRSATTSVRLWVLAAGPEEAPPDPAGDERAPRRPPSAAADAGGSGQATGTDSAGPSLGADGELEGDELVARRAGCAARRRG